MKRLVSLLLAIIMIATLAACSGLQDVSNSFSSKSNTKYVQNLFSGVNDLSEVKNYFDKTLGIDINDLNYFRIYELECHNIIKSLIQYRETEASPYKYYYYVSAGYYGLLVQNGDGSSDNLRILLPCDVTDISNTDDGHIVSKIVCHLELDNKIVEQYNDEIDKKYNDEMIEEYGLNYDNTGIDFDSIMISAADGRIVRMFSEKDKRGIITYEYNDNLSISAVNTYASEKNFSDEVLYDLEHSFEDDDYNVISKSIYSYNSDGSADQVSYIVRGKSIFNIVNGEKLYYNLNDNYKYYFEYDGKGYRKTENVINLDEVDIDNVNNDWETMHREYFVIEQDETGLTKKYYLVATEDMYENTHTINYRSDGLISSIELDETDGYLPGKEG